DLPARPAYFQQDVDVNRHGAPALDSLPPLAALAASDVYRRQQEGVTILDTRPATSYAAGHVPGSLQIGLGGQFASWAGSVIGLERDIILVAEDPAAAEESRMRLSRVGIDRVEGVLRDGIAGWAAAGLPLAMTGQISVQDLREQLPEFTV